MVALLERNLLVVTGKGGVGKTTLAAALGLLAAERGRRTIVVELGDHGRLPELFGVSAEPGGTETLLAENLASITIDPDRVLLEWVQQLGGRIPGRVLASSGTFQYFAAAAPGAKELFGMVKVWELRRRNVWTACCVTRAPAPMWRLPRVRRWRSRRRLSCGRVWASSLIAILTRSS
jgi:anion-transporting  ArsA/GET3 family ATPase